MSADHPHRTASSVLGRKAGRCPLCHLPFRPTDLVERVGSMGVVHAFCAGEWRAS